MAFLPRLFALLVTLGLLLGAVLPAGGAAVLCFGGDHVAVEARGGGHCGYDHGEGVPTVELDAPCVDVEAVSVTLDRSASASPILPSRDASPAILPAVAIPVAGRSGVEAGARGRPPPHLGPLSVLVLRV